MSSIVDNAKSIRKKQLALETRVDNVDTALINLITGDDFTLSEASRRRLLGYPCYFFIDKKWDGDTNKQYQKGNVILSVDEEIKWLVNNNGNVNPNPLESGLTTPFRSISEFNEDGSKRYWMKGEFCITGMHRWSDNEKRYVVKPRGDGGSLATDSSTPPQNNTNDWAEDPL